MEQKALIYLIILIGGVIGWLVWDQYAPMKINYERHSYLIDQKTGARIKPKDFIELKKVIVQSEEYINKTNSFDRLYDLIYQLNLEHASPPDHTYSSKESVRLSGQPVANRSKCGQDLIWILSKLDENQEHALLKGTLGYELTKLMDVMGKPASGTFSGLSTWLGSYKDCQRLSLRQQTIRMRFCWSRFRPKYWPQNETVIPRTLIRVGSCLPESCDTQSDSDYSETISRIIKHDWPEFFKRDLQLDSMYCLPDERSPLRQIPPQGHMFLALSLSWILLVLGGTLVFEIIRLRQHHRWKRATIVPSNQLELNGKVVKYHMEECSSLEEDQEGIESPVRMVVDCCLQSKLLESLSLREMLKKFKLDRFHVDYKHCNNRPRVDLSCLSFLKLSMCICILVGHTYFLGGLYTRSMNYRIEMATGPARTFVAFGRFVDTFFMMFAIFASYQLLNKFKAHQLVSPSLWLYYNLKAIIRVAPLFVIIYSFSRYVSSYLGSGPWWDYGTFKWSFRGYCQQEEWWKIVPHLASFGELHVSLCVPHGWFITVYLQLALMIPALIYIIYKIPNRWLSASLVSFILLASNALFALRLMRQETLDGEGFALYGMFVFSLLDKFQTTGILNTYIHIGVVAVSCFFGYLLHLYNVGKIPQWPRWLISMWTLFAVLIVHLVILLLPVLSPYITDYFQVMPTLGQVVLVNYLTFVAWPILNCILILQLSTVFNHLAFVRFLCHPFWSSFNQLGLCLYLIHWEVILHLITGNELGPPQVTASELVRLCSHVFIFTLLVSLFVYFFFELPTTTMFSLFLDRIYMFFSKPQSEIKKPKKVEVIEENRN